MPEGATEWDVEAGLPEDQTDAHECCDSVDEDEE
jgi:hypothetical protein